MISASSLQVPVTHEGASSSVYHTSLLFSICILRCEEVRSTSLEPSPIRSNLHIPEYCVEQTVSSQGLS
ncbi:hypothetical protein VTN96DRAFT_6815 [Rasamsonia emersonii]